MREVRHAPVINGWAPGLFLQGGEPVCIDTHRKGLTVCDCVCICMCAFKHLYDVCVVCSCVCLRVCYVCLRVCVFICVSVYLSVLECVCLC